jgi:hypothetical protein
MRQKAVFLTISARLNGCRKISGRSDRFKTDSLFHF